MNLSGSQRDMSGPRLGALSNNRRSAGYLLTTQYNDITTTDYRCKDRNKVDELRGDIGAI
jgi:hypothetical protein